MQREPSGVCAAINEALKNEVQVNKIHFYVTFYWRTLQKWETNEHMKRLNIIIPTLNELKLLKRLILR
jgi:cellulose synthase/poly-beta-1,6-N-acetylglucosamine synthase-like glycosyltransferase